MFSIKAKPSFWWTVQIPSPGDDPQPLEVEFRRKGTSAMKAFAAAVDGMEPLEAVADLVIGWRNVDAEFSRESLAAMLEEYPQAADAILRAYASAYRDAKRGN